MSGCEGCFTSQKGMEQELVNVRSKAKAFAKEENTMVAIYREAFRIDFIKAELSAGLNVIEQVTPY